MEVDFNLRSLCKGKNIYSKIYISHILMCSGMQDFFAHHDRVAFRIEAAKEVIDILIFTLYFKSSTVSNC